MKEDISFDPYAYFPDEGLKAAVEVARDLHMPLLVTGEPGTGKTELAKWIARELLKSGEPLRFDVKTTSQAKDLFYRYDAIRHYSNRKTEPNPLHYIAFEALGKAILQAREGAPRQVVLVDEIDKAPRDFPNDVLFQFEQFAFRIEEASREQIENFDFTKVANRKTIDLDPNDNIRLPHKKDDPKSFIEPPFLLLTSNSEKNLPDAFLRRCVFYHIPFPNRAELDRIVRAKARVSAAYLQQLDSIIEHFELLRDRGPIKKPATAELIRWVESMAQRQVSWDEIFAQMAKEKDPEKNAALKAELKKLQNTMAVLLKNKEDQTQFGAIMPAPPPPKKGS